MSTGASERSGRPPIPMADPRVVRRVGRFIVVAAMLFAAMVLAWRVVRPAYDRAFRAACNALFRHIAPQGETHFVVNPRYGETAIRLHKGEVRARRNVLIETWRWCWQPIAIVVALVLATPIPTSRRLRAVLLGMAAVHVWIAARIALRLLYKYASPGEVQQIDLGGFAFSLVEFLDRALLDSLDIFAVPLLIWIVVTFRRGDGAILLGTAAGGASNRARGPSNAAGGPSNAQHWV